MWSTWRLTPVRDILMPEPGPLRNKSSSTAHYADGSTRDVTREASYTSNTPHRGPRSRRTAFLASQRKGEAALLVVMKAGFRNPATTILTNTARLQWVQLPSLQLHSTTLFDHKLRKLMILPSQRFRATPSFPAPCVAPIITGPTAPNQRKLEAFLKDKTPQREKRTRLD